MAADVEGAAYTISTICKVAEDFSEADKNPKGFSSKYERNFTVSSKLEAKT